MKNAISDLIKPFYISLALVACFYPLILVIGYGIWAPTAMVQEVFSTNYAMYFYTKKYMFVETGFAFLALFDYPAAILAKFLNFNKDNFQQFKIFAYNFYLYHGLLLLAGYFVAYKMRLALLSKVLLLFIPITLLCLERVTNLNLIINYCKGEELYYLILAMLCMQDSQVIHKFPTNKKVVIWLGVFAGIIAATKLSLIFVMVPILYFLIVPKPFKFKVWFQNSLIFGSYAATTIFFSLLLFLQFKFKNLPVYFKQLFQYYSGELLAQRTPFLLSELQKMLHFESYYFGLHLLALAFTITYCMALYSAFRANDKLKLMLLLSLIIPMLFLYKMFWIRMSQGTMIDITLFITFATVLNISTILQHQRQLFAYMATTAVSLVFIISLISFHPKQILNGLQTNSLLAKEFNNFINMKSDIPTIYYMNGFPQPLMFPAADLIGSMRAAGAPDSEYLVNKYYPRIRYNSNYTLEEQGHYAIIPEYLDVITKSPAIESEWPQIWPGFSLLKTNLDFTKALQNRAVSCQKYQFIETQPRKYLIYYSSHPTLVTVCLIQ